MLLNGVNHVALLTHDTDRLVAFYQEDFDAEIGAHLEEFDGAVQLTFIRIGPTAELNVFQIEGNAEAGRQAPMFGRGRIDHLGLHAASLAAFGQIRDRLIARGASDRFVTDFGPVLSVFFRDPTAWRARCASRTPTPCPECTTRRAPPPPGTPRASPPHSRGRSLADWKVLRARRSGRSGCGHTRGHHSSETRTVGDLR